jgi:hypothetical protein
MEFVLTNDVVRYLCLFLFEPDSLNTGLNNLAQLSRTCRRFHRLVQPLITGAIYQFSIYRRALTRPDIVDSDGNEFSASPIGNFMWLIQAKTIKSPLRFIEKDVYDHYDGSERVFESCYVVSGKKGETITLRMRDDLNCSLAAVHYRANFGEILQIVWHFNCKNYHQRMVWTEGDVWIAQLLTPKYHSNIGYRYEVCVDHGGPVLRTESAWRYSLPNGGDIWDFFAPSNPSTSLSSSY